MSTSPLTDLFAARQLTVDPAELITYEVEAGMDRGKPDGVFFPETTADVSRIVQWAAATQTPLIARGVGMELAGGAVAEVDRWGMTPPHSSDAEIEIADTRELMAALKARWDPQVILNPGDHPTG